MELHSLVGEKLYWGWVLFSNMNQDVSKPPIEISKQLEIINFKTFILKYPDLKNRKDDFVNVVSKGKIKRWTLNTNKVSPVTKMSTKKNESKSQLAAFQQAMKLLLIIGQSLGLNPVRGILETDVGNMRFTVCYWRFIYSIVIGIAQAIATVLCLYRLLRESITVGELGYFSFYVSTCVTTLVSIQIGYKWPKLMKDISKCSLDEYVDPRIKFKCYAATATVFSMAILEHALSLLCRVVRITICYPDQNFYDEFFNDQFPWFFYLDIPAYVPIGIILQIVNIISTLNWNYSDAYIMCISIYLTSILEQINKKIIKASEKQHLPSSYWRALREDYNRATQLVRSFDNVVSGIIFSSFASNLFFICLQLFNILAHGVDGKGNLNSSCARLAEGPFGGYEYATYLLFSVTYLFARSITVSLVAASVNTASLVPAPALYNVPSSAFCDEVSRFIVQVNGDNVALSGLQFFYATRDLVLSIAGTIVTYELVLLQFSKDEKFV